MEMLTNDHHTPHIIIVGSFGIIVDYFGNKRAISSVVLGSQLQFWAIFLHVLLLLVRICVD